MKTAEITVLKSLILQQPVAALATLRDGAPAISMVPFAMLPEGAGFVIHVSSLASHTKDMLANPEVSLLVTASLEQVDTPLALPRVSIQGHAHPCPADSDAYNQARSCYLKKLPDAEELFSFADFSLWVIVPESLRFVAGFGRAMSLTPERLRTALLTDE
jgi:putative heme iron utilization protein